LGRGTSGDSVERGFSPRGLKTEDRRRGTELQLARVIGTVVATQKHASFGGAKLLLVQPVALDDSPRGTALLAVDSVGAGVNEKVLIVMEGRAAGEALGRKGAPVDAAIVGIVDHVDVHE